MAGKEGMYYYHQTRTRYDSKRFRFADLHGHTNYSDGVSSPQSIVDQARRRWLSAIAVTDHNTPEGGKVAEEYAHQLGLRNYVIVGSEVSSNDGHIVGLNVRHQMKQGLSAEETNYQIHRRGGLSVAVHPGVGLVTGVSLDVIRRVQEPKSREAQTHFDAMERANGSVIRLRKTPVRGKKDLPQDEQDTSDDFYQTYGMRNGLASVGGSDYHGLDVGYAVTAYTGEDVLEDIKQQRTAAAVREDVESGWLMEYFYLRLGELRKRLRQKSKV
jgi:hypothetical protein